MTNKKGYRNNFSEVHHIEDLASAKNFMDGELNVPYNLQQWKTVFSGVPTDNLYYDENEDGPYMIDNGKGMMFYFEADDIYYPANPVNVSKTYYKHLLMWENKQYDLIFPDVPEDFQNKWFQDCVSDMPLKMAYPIFSKLKFGQFYGFNDEAKALIEQSKNMQ